MRNLIKDEVKQQGSGQGSEGRRGGHMDEEKGQVYEQGYRHIKMRNLWESRKNYEYTSMSV